MEITWQGVLLIPVFFTLLFKKPRYLLYAAIFLSGFSASSVLNFPNVEFGLQPSQLAILFLLIHFSLFKIPRIFAQQDEGRSIASLRHNVPFLVAFLILDVFSLALGPEGVTPTGTTQLIHMGFGCTTLALVAVYAMDEKAPDRLLKAFIWSSIFISLWGFIQLSLFYLGIPYPDFLFNNTTSKNALGFRSMLETAKVLRISSVATEPSILSKFLVPILAAMLAAVRKGGKTIQIPKWQILVVLLTLMISTSSGAYIGVAVLLVFNFLNLRMLLKNRRFLLGLLGTMGIVVGFALAFPSLIREMVIGKFSSFSFLERTASVIEGFEVFTANPLLGVGWGNFQGFDFLAKILASTGILGALAFAGFLVQSLRLPIVRLRQLNIPDPDRAAIFALATMAGFQVFQMSIVGFFPSYEDFWIVFGVLTGAAFRPLLRQNSPTLIGSQR